MATLIKGINAVGLVSNVHEAFESFDDTKSGVGGKRYCHGFNMTVDGIEYACQYCSTSEHLTEFGEGDTIAFTVKSLSRNIHTIGLLSVQRTEQKTHAIPPAAVPIYGHFNLAGTPEALGLQYAAQIYSNRLEIDEVAITELAHAFTMYLRNEYQTNINPQY